MSKEVGSIGWFRVEKVFVFKIQVNSILTILKYGIYYDFMDR